MVISYSLSGVPSTALDLNYNVKQLVAGGRHTCVLFENGRVKCWGGNNYGQLGLGHTASVGSSSLILPKNIPFTNVGEKVLKLSSGEDPTPVLSLREVILSAGVITDMGSWVTDTVVILEIMNIR